LKRIVTLAVAAASLLAGAGGSAASAAPRAALPQITVTMTGKAIHVTGALVSGGVRIVSRATGERAGDPALIRLNPGVTIGQFFAGLQRSAGDLNGVNGAIVVDAETVNGTSTVQAALAPGQYVALDTAGQNPAKWPFTAFVIRPASSPAALPAPQATLSAIEFGFRGPGTLRDGQLVRFANSGWLVHMIVAARAPSAAVARQIVQLLQQGKDSQAQRLSDNFATFAGPLSHGAFQQLVVDVQPGFWVVACFMNSQDGREHTQLGMERVIQVVR
jgi:hypothetical protein